MTNRIRPVAMEITFNEDSITVLLKDGDNLRVPLQ